MCGSVRVRALKGKQLELLTVNVVHILCVAVARRALTGRSKVKGQGHTVAKPSWSPNRYGYAVTNER